MIDILFAAVAAFTAGSILFDKKTEKTPLKTNKIIVPKSQSEIFSEIREKNKEIIELHKKEEIDGFINENDKSKIINLADKRDAFYKNFEKLKENELINKVNLTPEKFDNFQISQEKIHLIQYHVGETVLGKKCPTCNEPMILQFPRGMESVNFNDFFWACTAWYSRTCNTTEPFRISDMSLFTENNKNEFHINNNSLTQIFNDQSIQNHTLNRVSNHRGETTEDYVCPIHKEPLILRKKNNDGGALDAFFLGCSLWKPNNGCNYVLKLKSPAQLASFLQKTENQGII